MKPATGGKGKGCSWVLPESPINNTLFQISPPSAILAEEITSTIDKWEATPITVETLLQHAATDIAIIGVLSIPSFKGHTGCIQCTGKQLSYAFQEVKTQVFHEAFSCTPTKAKEQAEAIRAGANTDWKIVTMQKEEVKNEYEECAKEVQKYMKACELYRTNSKKAFEEVEANMDRLIDKMAEHELHPLFPYLESPIHVCKLLKPFLHRRGLPTYSGSSSTQGGGLITQPAPLAGQQPDP
ncbi:hypothetical protein EDD18DRAFT_1354114 [Armillaria luteobubalina]|uniref:Uncharacterized protein n=1 Tax=Armillaria luteobubalina TaxID=153913 RepID=A0AA39Q3K4_9AGAR|nr:hypothetical protein EDD18DRAFT_1354114 [Armillaria luteobubalina]